MFGSILGGAYILDPPPGSAMTRHELGQHDDYAAGLVPMAQEIPPVRVPPPFPLAAYLVMKRAE